MSHLVLLILLLYAVCLAICLPITSTPLDNNPDHLAWDAAGIVDTRYPPEHEEGRKIPKSIFIAPHLNESQCAPGYKRGVDGKCYKNSFNIDEMAILAAQIQSVLPQNTTNTAPIDYGDYDYDGYDNHNDDQSSGPYHVPLSISFNDQFGVTGGGAAASLSSKGTINNKGIIIKEKQPNLPFLGNSDAVATTTTTARTKPIASSTSGTEYYTKHDTDSTGTTVIIISSTTPQDSSTIKLDTSMAHENLKNNKNSLKKSSSTTFSSKVLPPTTTESISNKEETTTIQTETTMSHTPNSSSSTPSSPSSQSSQPSSPSSSSSVSLLSTLQPDMATDFTATTIQEENPTESTINTKNALQIELQNQSLFQDDNDLTSTTQFVSTTTTNTDEFPTTEKSTEISILENTKELDDIFDTTTGVSSINEPTTQSTISTTATTATTMKKPIIVLPTTKKVQIVTPTEVVKIVAAAINPAIDLFTTIVSAETPSPITKKTLLSSFTTTLPTIQISNINNNDDNHDDHQLIDEIHTKLSNVEHDESNATNKMRQTVIKYEQNEDNIDTIDQHNRFVYNHLGGNTHSDDSQPMKYGTSSSSTSLVTPAPQPSITTPSLLEQLRRINKITEEHRQRNKFRFPGHSSPSSHGSSNIKFPGFATDTDAAERLNHGGGNSNARQWSMNQSKLRLPPPPPPLQIFNRNNDDYEESDEPISTLTASSSSYPWLRNSWVATPQTFNPSESTRNNHRRHQHQQQQRENYHQRQRQRQRPSSADQTNNFWKQMPLIRDPAFSFVGGGGGSGAGNNYENGHHSGGYTESTDHSTMLRPNSKSPRDSLYREQQPISDIYKVLAAKNSNYDNR